MNSSGTLDPKVSDMVRTTDAKNIRELSSKPLKGGI